MGALDPPRSTHAADFRGERLADQPAFRRTRLHPNSNSATTAAFDLRRLREAHPIKAAIETVPRIANLGENRGHAAELEFAAIKARARIIHRRRQDVVEHDSGDGQPAAEGLRGD